MILKVIVSKQYCDPITSQFGLYILIWINLKIWDKDLGLPAMVGLFERVILTVIFESFNINCHVKLLTFPNINLKKKEKKIIKLK